MGKEQLKKEEFSRLDLSGNQYYVTKNGKVVDVDGYEIVPEFDADGRYWVKLNWYKGDSFYELARVVLHAHRPLRLPFHFWDIVQVGYLDKDTKNTELNNLYWVHTTPIESRRYPGFFYIPNFSRYVLSKTGAIKVSLTNVLVEEILDTTYPRVALKRDDDVWQQKQIHRVLAEMFIPHPTDTVELQVNHKNGIKTDFSLGNLEWATAQENVQHAVVSGLLVGRREIIGKNLSTGSEIRYASLVDCAAQNHIDRKTIAKHVQHGTAFRGVLYGFSDEETNSQELKRTPVAVRNIHNGQVTIYPTRTSCAKACGLSDSVLTDILSRGKQVITREGFQIKKHNPDVEWETVDDVNKVEFFETVRRRVLVRNVETGVVTEYDSILAVTESTGLHKDLIRYRLGKTGQPVFPDKTQMKYLNDPTPWRIPQDADREVLDSSWSKAVLARNVLTGEIREYAKSSDCCHEHGLKAAALSTRLSTGDQSVYKTGWQFKLKKSSEDWKIPEDPVKAVQGYRNSRPVLARYAATDEVKEFPTLKRASELHTLNITTLSYRLTKDPKTVYPGGVQFKYKDNPQPWV